MSILVTGVAGFIGSHVALALLERGDAVIGIGSQDAYPESSLKHARLARLEEHKHFTFHTVNLCDVQQVKDFRQSHPEIKQIIHLAAQSSVRNSLTNPHIYASNLVGHLNMLEMARGLPDLKQMIYASSSAVYGANTKLPFSVDDPVDQPLSLYAATKRSCELMSHTYNHLYGIPLTGVRFFSVYGPWGRSDMLASIFTQAIIEGRELSVFDHGKIRCTFTYIDDTVNGILLCLDRHLTPPASHHLYNIGNDKSEGMLRFIEVLEGIIGKKARLKMEPKQTGDVRETLADITKTTQDLGFKPKVDIEEGLSYFVDWYKRHQMIGVTG